MSLILKDSKENDYNLGVWELSEPESYYLNNLTLSSNELSLLNNAKTDKRRIEILSVRLLLKSLGINSEISYSETGKPIVEGGKISISHSRNYSAIIFHKYRDVAIDIEKKSRILLQSQHLAFSKSEIEFARNDLEILTTLWCCKECVVKITNNKKVNYLTQIYIRPFSNNSIIECDYIKQGIIYRYEFYHAKLKDHIIVWGCNGREDI